jgi:putative hydrolase
MALMAEPVGSEPPQVPLGDILGEIPLFREIQRVLLSSSGPVNWELARQVGIAVASWGAEDPQPSREDLSGLLETVRAAELAVKEFTGLATPTHIVRVQAFRRTHWVEESTRSLRSIIDPVAERLARALSDASGPMPAPVEAFGGGNEQMMEALMQRMVPLLLGAQVGGVLGNLGQRALGQYDLAIPRADGPLYFVIPNIARFEKDWSLDPREFRAWVALHEVTHWFEFGLPWAAEHFLAIVRDLVAHAELDLSGLEERLESLDLSDPQALTGAFEAMNDVFGRSDDPEQRLRIARVQSFMAAAEGYGDHVTEAVGRRMLGAYGQIDEAVRRYRDGRHGEQALERLLGIELKVEQYQLARAFCSRVSELTDEATLARMWESAESLPSMPELEEPTLWLSRMT